MHLGQVGRFRGHLGFLPWDFFCLYLPGGLLASRALVSVKKGVLLGGVFLKAHSGWEGRSRHSSWESRRRRNRGIMGVQVGTCRLGPRGQCVVG